MRGIKFRYVFRKPNGHIILYYTDIQHLEHGDIADFLQHNFLSIERDLISRDEFTGHKDKKGVEIYEGDIIKSPKESLVPITIYRITWNQELCKFDCVGSSVSGNWWRHISEEVEVIGNIYENPGLVKEVI